MTHRKNLISDFNWENRILLIFGITFLAFLLLLIDIVFDYFEWYHPIHYVSEVIPLISLTLLLLYLSQLLLQLKIEATIWQKRAFSAEENVKKRKQEIKEIIDGLSKVIDHQFDIWKLTIAEKEIGMLILKGMSFKEISQIRFTSERTVRQQTVEIYKKSHTSGRAQFSAFFLEDLLVPIEIK